MLEVYTEQDEQYQDIASLIIKKHEQSKAYKSTVLQVQYEYSAISNLVFEVVYFVGIIILYFTSALQAFIPAFRKQQNTFIKAINIFAVLSLVISNSYSFYSLKIGWKSYFKISVKVRQIFKICLALITTILSIFFLIRPSKITGELLFFCTALNLGFVCNFTIKKIRYNYVQQYSSKRYFNIMVLLCSNIAFIHFITSILLEVLLMSRDQCKVFKAKLFNDDGQPKWYAIYFLAYYWESTIMFRVGFGDITPPGWKQATIIAIVELYAGFMQSYFLINIINNYRQIHSLEIQNKRINLRKVLKSHFYNDQLRNELENTFQNLFYKEQIELKNIYQETQLNSQDKFQQGYYDKMLNLLPFFSDLNEKTISIISTKLNSQFYYPQEQLNQKLNGALDKILILKEGVININTRRPKSQLNNLKIGQLALDKKKQWKLLNSDLLSEIKRENICLVSDSYSECYILHYKDLQLTLKQLQFDRQLYFQLLHSNLHRSSYLNYQIKCQVCTQVFPQYYLQQSNPDHIFMLSSHHLPIQCYFLVYCVEQKTLALRKIIDQNGKKLGRRKSRILKPQNNLMRCSLKAWRNMFKVWSQKWGIQEKITKKSNQVPYSTKKNFFHKYIEDSMFNFEVDKAHDFQNYFKDFNASLICLKYRMSKRIKE